MESELEVPNLSFSMKGNTNTNFSFQRSVSTKESPLPHPDNLVPLPPRLSATTATPFSLFDFPAPPTPRLSFTPDSSKFASSTEPDAPTYYCVASVLKKDGQILCIAGTNELIYTGSQGNAIRVWNVPEMTECGQLKSKATVVVALQVLNDRVYAAYADCKARIWRRTWEGAVKHVRVGTVPAPGGFVRNYIAGRDKTQKHVGPITSLAVNIPDDVLYSSSLDKTIKVWRISDFKCIETIQAHHEPINAIAVSDDGTLYTASDDATVKVWQRDFCTMARLHSLTVTLPVKCSPVKALTLTLDGKVLYGGCSDGYVHYWVKGWVSGQLQYGGALAGHTHSVLCLASMGDYVVSGSADVTSRVWVREPDGIHTCIAVLQGHRGPIRCATMVFDDNLGEAYCNVCTGSVDGVIKVWRVRNTTKQGKDSSNSAREYFELT